MVERQREPAPPRSREEEVSLGGRRSGDCCEEELAHQPPELAWRMAMAMARRIMCSSRRRWAGHTTSIRFLSFSSPPYVDPLYPGTLHGVSPSPTRPSMLFKRRSLSPSISHRLGTLFGTFILVLRRQSLNLISGLSLSSLSMPLSLQLCLVVLLLQRKFGDFNDVCFNGST
jgi:hypothetical protein